MFTVLSSTQTPAQSSIAPCPRFDDRSPPQSLTAQLSSITFDGRPLIVSLAVSRGEVASLHSERNAKEDRCVCACECACVRCVCSHLDIFFVQDSENFLPVMFRLYHRILQLLVCDLLFDLSSLFLSLLCFASPRPLTAPRRHGHLAREGLILEGEEAAEGISKQDLEKRTRLWQETKEKLKNPNFVVSPTRLSVTNLPPGCTDAQVELRACV